MFLKRKKIVFLAFFICICSFSLQARVYTGLEVFLTYYTNLVKDKRVGLVTNQTGVNAEKISTVNLFHRNPNIRLVALFAPEHGIKGNLKAGETVPGGRDSATGLPVYTLYGANGHKPTKEALSQIDVLIYDIQDVGSRAYTYIWHLAECMNACAEARKTVIVLDRPNPLGANTTDGPVVEKEYLSFIGLYPVPRVYGMTVGELAVFLNKEEKINCPLYVIPMMNYRRGMAWNQTGLPWISPSPNIPTPEAACCFAATGTIGETGAVNIGIGALPFQMIAAVWLNAANTASALNNLRLPGVLFKPVYYTTAVGRLSNNYGVQIIVSNPAIFRPAATEIAILCHLKKCYPKNFSWTPDGNTDRLNKFDRAMGTSFVRRAVDAGWDYTQIVREYEKTLQPFRTKRAGYLIYK